MQSILWLAARRETAGEQETRWPAASAVRYTW